MGGGGGGKAAASSKPELSPDMPLLDESSAAEGKKQEEIGKKWTLMFSFSSGYHTHSQLYHSWVQSG